MYCDGILNELSLLALRGGMLAAKESTDEFGWRLISGFQQYLQFAEAINILYELHSWFIFFQTSILVQLVIRWLQQW